MAFDLKNLEGVFATGKLLGDGESLYKYVMTPICRFNFVRLQEAKGTDKNPRKTWGITPIFQVAPGPARVQIEPVLVKAILEMAKENENPLRQPPKAGADRAAFNQWVKDFGSPALAYCFWRKWVRPGDESEKENEDGTFRPGFGPGTVFFSATQYANEEGSNPPTIRGGSGATIKPSLVKPGYYGRLGLDLYWNAEYSRVCFGLKEVQLLAKGEEIGGIRGFDFSAEFGKAVEGADDFSNESITDEQMWDTAGTGGGNDGLPF
jgi:hypothetical protein